MEDERFKDVLSDPKFRRIPKNERKIKIDNRFRSMFNNKNFTVEYTVDKHGRPVQHSSSKDLKRYYELSSEEDSSEEEDEDSEVGQYVKAPKSDEEDLNETHASDKVVAEDIKTKLRDLNVDYARGEGRLYSESSSDDSESEEEEESDTETIEHKWGELDADAEKTEEVTRRLAACNMDWDRIRAVDLMVLFHSFLPPGGCIESITIYPSEFGKQRMKEEETRGPIELVETKIEEEETEEGNEEGSRYHMEKLRQYQLNRLKYYYAVIVCDSVNTANKIYTECDGMEYESSATKIDLRFIPDDMTFDEEPKEFCNKLPELNKYQPRFFTTTALQQAKVDLTWDETNPDRVELTQKLSSGKVDDVTDADLETYLALSSDEENEDAQRSSEEEENDKFDDPIDKYKALLQDIEEEEQKKKNRDVEMEVTWGIELEKKTEELVKKKLGEKEEKTPFQEYLEKRKQKRKERKKTKKQQENEDSDVPSDVDLNDPYFAEEFDNVEFKKKNKKKSEETVDGSNNTEKEAELELLLMNEDDGKKHFSLKRIQEQEGESKSKKKRRKKEAPSEKDNFAVDVKDARFSALYTSHHFNIDPTDPHYKKTKGMEAIVQEKLKRRAETDDVVNGSEEQGHGKKKDAVLSVLVKSVKRKAGTGSNS